MEKLRTPYLEGQTILMAENLHTQIPSINKFIDRSELCSDN